MRGFVPFTNEIQRVPVPHNFREPVIDSYDGSKDPQAHMAAFETQMSISGGDDAIICKMFAGTLKDTALKWFTGFLLGPSSALMT